MQYLACGGTFGIACLNELLIAAAERRVLIVETAGCNDLPCMQSLAVACVSYHFLAPYTVVLIKEVKLVNHLTFKIASVTGFKYLHLAHHLADNNLKVLIVDFHTLQTIYRLCLIDYIVLYGSRSLNGKDIIRRNGTV